MKDRGVLHPTLSRTLAETGHGDRIALADTADPGATSWPAPPNRSPSGPTIEPSACRYPDSRPAPEPGAPEGQDT